MSPPTARRPPGGRASAIESAAGDFDVSTIDTGPDRWVEAFTFGWHVGHADGRRAAEVELDRAWAETARKIRRIGAAVSYDELRRRRAVVQDLPCASACGRCSQCVRSGWLDRHGADFPGQSGVERGRNG